jgi:glycosyltransferase involved in cell wall biosynthesis
MVNMTRPRACIVYDCLYPYTIGGAERWYRELASAFFTSGREVVYLTRRQWSNDEPPALEGIRIKVVSGPDALYNKKGNRRISEALKFGWGVFRHLLAHRHDYELVHLCSFPYFSLIAARLALAGTHTQIGVDWFEVWSDSYWKRYLGRSLGRVGIAVQKVCIRLTPLAFSYSDLAAGRLKAQGLQSDPIRLRGMHPGTTTSLLTKHSLQARPLLLWIGRLIPEKRAHLVPYIMAELLAEEPSAHAIVVGSGPEEVILARAISDTDMSGFVSAPGFVERDELLNLIGQADCLLVTSLREGYGVVVLEAAAHGTPVVVVDAEDNAASELIAPGVNGYRVASDSPSVIAQTIAQVLRDGQVLRDTTLRWFKDNADSLDSATIVVRAYDSKT